MMAHYMTRVVFIRNEHPTNHNGWIVFKTDTMDVPELNHIQCRSESEADVLIENILTIATTIRVDDRGAIGKRSIVAMLRRPSN